MLDVGIHSKPINGVVMDAPDAAECPRTASTANEPERRERRRRDGTSFIVIALLNAAIVAVVAFSGSWQHQYELSVRLGQAHWVAGMQPLSVEGLLAAATLVIWYAGRHGYRRRDAWAAYLVLAAGIGQTVLMNLGADSPWPWLGPEISVWPAVAFVAAYEMAVWLVRKRQDGAVQSRVDKPADKQPDIRVDKPAARKSIPPRSALDKAAAAIKRHPDWTDAELAGSLGVSTKTIQRARKTP